ncbi:gag/pol protein [Cucumis melo var. makuwa]|uniref:Gag/pol protein n=1 Tax=Cucumis melo var. makuwa TaxID=1194695 RepID=A0A5A7TE24_CUCMM|nr:gag/pol protein [Cucumis melo var. makuwa]
MILVIVDLRFVLMEECPPFPTQNASQSIRDTYDHWTKANDKAHLYILASMSNIPSKKHEIMIPTRQIMDSLRKMFGKPSILIKQEAIKYVYNARMKEGQFVREHVLDMIVNFNIAEINGAKQKGGKGKGPTAAVEGKGKAKVAIKGKCFHCNMGGHWKKNCSKYLAKKKEKEGATNHVCSSLQETSSFEQLEEGEMTLKVGTGGHFSSRSGRC